MRIEDEMIIMMIMATMMIMGEVIVEDEVFVDAWMMDDTGCCMDGKGS